MCQLGYRVSNLGESKLVKISLKLKIVCTSRKLNRHKGPFVNYESIFLPIFDQVRKYPK